MLPRAVPATFPTDSLALSPWCLSRPCCRWVMGASSLALGVMAWAAACFPSCPLASPQALAKAVASVLLSPIVPWAHISIGWWPSDFSCLSHLKWGQLPEPTRFWCLPTGVHAFPTFCSRRPRSLRFRPCGEGLEGAGDEHFSGHQRTPEISCRWMCHRLFPWRCPRHSIWHFNIICSGIYYFFTYSNRNHSSATMCLAPSGLLYTFSLILPTLQSI